MTEIEIQKAKDYIWEFIKSGTRDSILRYATSDFLQERSMIIKDVNVSIGYDYPPNSNEDIAGSIVDKWQLILFDGMWSKVFTCAVKDIESRIREIDSMASLCETDGFRRKQLFLILGILKEKLGNQQEMEKIRKW
jgi:hypothetical protein